MPKWLWKMTNTPAIISALIVTLSFIAGVAHGTSLNKCLDVYGKVTYSNLPCKGANEVRKIEIDPAPPVPNVAPVPALPKVDMPDYSPISVTSSLPPEKKAAIKLETFGATPRKNSQNTCDTLTDKLGLVLDKMDVARRKGYTQKQMDQWNSEIKSLERKKQQTGCF